ncbi:unnamed protein product [Lactuca saligna]|uniref:Uncharacterized protein n=1 Tax=Lactuca saligna TaxID=75948 RepID=A0AA35ZJY6_LACSI|nr:unnamed protein product [Lactuca saligna]
MHKWIDAPYECVRLTYISLEVPSEKEEIEDENQSPPSLEEEEDISETPSPQRQTSVDDVDHVFESPPHSRDVDTEVKDDGYQSPPNDDQQPPDFTGAPPSARIPPSVILHCLRVLQH